MEDKITIDREVMKAYLSNQKAISTLTRDTLKKILKEKLEKLVKDREQEIDLLLMEAFDEFLKTNRTKVVKSLSNSIESCFSSYGDSY